MYAVGTSILYGRMGVCRVESIGAPPYQQDNGRRYYKLRSVFSSSGELIYIPVDAAGAIRPLINGGEASDYLDLLPHLKPKAFYSKRPSDVSAHYQEMLSSCELKDCLLLLKEIHSKEKTLAARSKKLGQVDAKYLKVVERLVCEEFAAALDTTPDQMKGRLYEAMEGEAAS